MAGDGTQGVSRALVRAFQSEELAGQGLAARHGIGIHLTTSADAPYFDCSRKLQEYAGVTRRKCSLV